MVALLIKEEWHFWCKILDHAEWNILHTCSMLEIHKDCLFFTLFRYFWELKLKGGGGGGVGVRGMLRKRTSSIQYFTISRLVSFSVHAYMLWCLQREFRGTLGVIRLITNSYPQQVAHKYLNICRLVGRR